ncbi:Uncharacterised protein [Salmonella enterica subsp. indica]|uniref:Conjugal transfer protein TraL n=1 Tax=Salmonella enterica subsp. indica TaxID=59207 RepID=A0A379YSE8_SALER|nr:hypothetical protein [Salmonella enterica]SUI48758.1 Uncharacterised protein [Salmonella enterica subsp. indica]
MKPTTTIIALSFAVPLLAISLPSRAASQDECAIWLCLPAGFGQGCDAAKSAFKKRIRKGKSPLPSFSSCATDTGDSLGSGVGELTQKSGVASWIPGQGYVMDADACRISWNGHTRPSGCRRVSYTAIYQNGVMLGSPQFY